MRSDLIKEKYSGFPGRMLPFIVLGKSRTFFWTHTEKQHGNEMYTAALLEDNFQLSRWGMEKEELQKELQLSNKIWQLLQEEYRNSRSVCSDHVFHLKVSCWILNPTKLSAASRITNKKPGANLKPLGSSESRKQKCWLCMLLQKSLSCNKLRMHREKTGSAL